MEANQSMQNNDYSKPRKRIMVLPGRGGDSSVITEALGNGVFDLRFVSDPPQLAKSLQEFKPALLLLEIDSWKQQTRDLLCKLADLKNTQPFRRVILSESATVDDRVSALELGADDFLAKPISPRELLARLQAVLRADTSFAVEENIRSFGSLSLYSGLMEVSIGNDRKKLSLTEFNLLSYFMDHPGQVLSRDRLLENVWIPWEIEDRRVVDVYVLRLRQKIEESSAHPSRLITRRGEGYLLVDPFCKT
jgi:DNA-binding response OmpR family regulator